MSVILAVFTDGRRDCIERTIPSALDNLRGLSDTSIIFDDSADVAYGAWLRATFGGFHVQSAPARRGFGGSIREAWSVLSRPTFDQFEHVFHLEDDFTFNRPVDLTTMAHTLALHPDLVQLALRRQPWNDAERTAGGIVEQHPDDYTERTNGSLTRWMEHRRFFTTNPSLYRRSLCAKGWPAGEQTEGRFGIDLFREPSTVCGFWGGRDSGEWVTHIGSERVGSGY